MYIGQKIKQLRKEKGMTLSELAKKSGCAKSQIWTVENNASANPTSKWIFNIAKAFGVTVDYFLAGERKTDAEDTAFVDMYLSLPAKTKKQIRDIGLILKGSK